jgi:hypothetical protein
MQLENMGKDFSLKPICTKDLAEMAVSIHLSPQPEAECVEQEIDTQASMVFTEEEDYSDVWGRTKIVTGRITKLKQRKPLYTLGWYGYKYKMLKRNRLKETMRRNVRTYSTDESEDMENEEHSEKMDLAKFKKEKFFLKNKNPTVVQA